MTQSAQIASRFREIMLQGDWVAGTNYKAQLSSVSWQEAVKKNGPHNSIAQLSFHIHYYIEGLLNVLNGEPLTIKDKFSFQMPAIGSEAEWQLLLQNLWLHCDQFAAAIEAMPDEKLSEAFIDDRYGDYRRNLNAMIEHCYYHLGQIVLIRKLQQEPGI